MITLQNKFVL